MKGARTSILRRTTDVTADVVSVHRVLRDV